MRKRAKKKMLMRRVCPSCRGNLDKIRYVDLDMKVRCPNLRCVSIHMVLRKKKWVIK